MDIGVFIPIGNNGWLVSTTSPQYKPSFELNERVVQRAEHHGFDFALSMIKLRGFGGPSEFWDYNLESFTLMAGLAARTQRIKLYASSAILSLHPAIAARMAVTIDSIAPGRFGINIVTGWQRAEYAQMGLWRGDEHYERRYTYAAEYVTILRELWDDGVSNLRGEYFTMDDCVLQPGPLGPIEVVCAGQSNAGIEFCARHGDVNFVVNTGVNTPTAHASTNERVQAAADHHGRNVGVYVLVMVIAEETDEAAFAKWRHYQEGVDLVALARASGQASADTNSQTAESSARIMSDAERSAAVNMGMGVVIGSYEHVAEMLDEMAAIPGTKGLMLTFDDYDIGPDAFGARIQPLMACRVGRGTSSVTAR